MFPSRLRQGIARASSRTTGLRAVHTSKRASDNSKNSGAQSSNPASGAVLTEFMKTIRKDAATQAASASSRTGAAQQQQPSSSDAKLFQVEQILNMLSPIATAASGTPQQQQQQQQPRSKYQKTADSHAQLFEILFPTGAGAAAGAAGGAAGAGQPNEALHKIFASSFASSRKRNEEFKYWAIFPKQIKKWLIYTRTPKGFYGDNGKWMPAFQQEMITTPKSDAQRDAEFRYHSEKYQQEQMLLPEDLRGQFRMGITPEEVADLKLHPKLKRIFSFKNATASEINQFRAKKYVEMFGYHVADTGNSAVQVAVLTMRINNLLERAKKHVTDRHNKFRLNNLIQRRKSLLKHLKKANLELYYTTLKAVSLKDAVEVFPTKFV